MLLPWNILAAFLMASGFHELCHLAALRCIRVPVHQIRLGFLGARITAGAMLPGQELICAAAGPAGSLMLAIFARYLPVTAVFGLVQGTFNLLPVYPLDGGRVVRSIFMLAKNAHCDYNSPDHKQRGTNHD